MKKHRLLLLVPLVALVALLLSGCGGSMVNGWPGVSANQNAVYLSFQGAVYAVNADNGNLIWQFPKEKPDPGKPFFVPAAFGPDGMVIVGNYGHTLYALDANGASLWQYAIPDGHFSATALVEGQTILAPASNNYLYAFDLKGNYLWKFETGNMLWARPVSDGTFVFFPGLDHKLYAVNLNDGKEVWNLDLQSALLSGPILATDGHLILSTLEGDVLAIDPNTQSVVWRTPTGGRVWATPAMNGDMLYVGNAANQILAITSNDGKIAWSHDIGSPVIGGAVIFADGVAFPTEGGDLVAWDFQGAKQLWTKPIGGKLYSAPVVVGDRLVVAITSGEEGKLLQALTISGQDSWSFARPK